MKHVKPLTQEQEAHLSEICFEVEDLIETKYTAGASEHGGNLWEKEGLIDEAIAEAIDQVVYLLTIKKQLERAGVDL